MTFGHLARPARVGKRRLQADCRETMRGQIAVWSIS